MVSVSVYKEIHRCKRFGRSKSEAARELGLSRTTRFDLYRDDIVTIVELNAADGGQVHGSSIYDVLEERHGELPGSERTLRGYVRMLRETGAIDTSIRRPVRRPQEESKPGDQLQVDFGEYPLSGGRKVYIYAAVLGASRMRYVSVQEHPFRTVEVIRHTLDCFRYFGGRPKKLVIDQDRLMTVSEHAGEIRHTAEFEHFVREQDLQVWLCRKADPQSKGKVENLVKFVKTSFFSARRFESVDEIHAPLDAWLVRRANGRIHQATRRIPLRVLEREERVALRALKDSIYDQRPTGGDQTRKVDMQGLVSFEGNRYSVPAEYVRRTVAVRADRQHVRLHDIDTGTEIAIHSRRTHKGGTYVREQHRTPKGYGRNEAYEELHGRINSGEWKQYLDAHREQYKRHWKDQTGLLRHAQTPLSIAMALGAVNTARKVGGGDTLSSGPEKQRLRVVEQALLTSW